MSPSEMQQALDRLPHGPAFRFIDKLLELTPGQTGSAEYKIRGDESFLEGHFPGAPMMPGVILVEALAQLAGVVAQSDPLIGPLANLKLTAIRQAKILGSARPGETLRLEAQVTGRLAQLIQAQGRVHVGDREILQAQVTLSGEKSLGIKDAISRG